MEVDSIRELHNIGKNLSFVRLLSLERIPDTLTETQILADCRYIESTSGCAKFVIFNDSDENLIDTEM